MKLILTIMLMSILLITGCSTMTADNIPHSLQLSGNDIIVGEVLTAEIRYSGNENALKEQLIAKALQGTNYDFLIMPRYEIVPGIIKKMKIRGRGARVK